MNNICEVYHTERGECCVLVCVNKLHHTALCVVVVAAVTHWHFNQRPDQVLHSHMSYDAPQFQDSN